MRIEDYEPRNELGLSKSDMRFCFIILAIVAVFVAAGWISTLVRWG